MKKIYKRLVTCSLAVLAMWPATAVKAQTEAEKGQTFYAYRVDQLKKDAEGFSAPSVIGWVSFNTSDTTKVTLLKKCTGAYDMEKVGAGEYLDGKIYTYGYQYDASDYDEAYQSTKYIVYDAETFTPLKTIDRYGERRVSDMTYDYTTNTMYALAEDKETTDRELQITSLNIVNTETGELTRVGGTGELLGINGYGRVVDDNLVTLACDKNGDLYAMSAYRHFYKLDKFSGKATEIGKEHKLAVESFFQSMAFGADGVLYWTQHTAHPYGWLTTIDTATGVPTKIGTLGDNDKLTCLFQKRSLVKTFPLAATDLKAVNDEVKHNQVTLTWTLPTKNYDGTDANLTEVRVYRLGTAEPIAVLGKDATSFVDEHSDNGQTAYEVVAVNAAAPGTPATVSLFAGYDQLVGVNDLHAVKNDATNEVSLSWTKPTLTVNNEYADFDNIVYNVYRVNLLTQKYELLSKNQKELTFSEVVTTEGIYCYVVEAVSGGVIGLGAKTENVSITETKVPPFTAKFEKKGDCDGLFWTAANAPHKYGAGWSISSYVDKDFDGYYARLYKASGSEVLNDWLISPPIKMEKGEYNLSYYGKGSEKDKWSWTVMLGTDGNDLTTFTTELDRHENEIVFGDKTVQGGWKQVCNKNFTITTSGIYHIGLYSDMKVGSYISLCIDNLSITPVTDGINSVKDTAAAKLTFNNDVAEVSGGKTIKQWMVFNAQGQQVMQGLGNGTANVQIGLSALNHGLYIVSVTTTDGAVQTLKLKR